MRVVWSHSAKFMTIIRQTGILMRVDEVRTDPTSARFVCTSDMLCMSGFPIPVEHAAAAKAPCLFTRGQPESSKRNGATMKRQCGNAMVVPQVGAVILVAVARFPTQGTRSITSIPPVISSAQRTTGDHDDHDHATGEACGGGHAAEVAAGRKRHLEPMVGTGPTRSVSSWTYDRVVRARRARGLI